MLDEVNWASIWIKEGGELGVSGINVAIPSDGYRTTRLRVRSCRFAWKTSFPEGMIRLNQQLLRNGHQVIG